MNTIQWHLFKHPPICKTQDRFCHLFFMHRNEMELLAPFAKVNKRGVGKKYKKNNKHPPSCIKHTRVDLHSFTQFINISFTTSM